MTTSQTVPERIVDLLIAEQSDTIFGIPDPSLFSMFLTAEKRGMKIVAPHHEQGGALMADGYYRMTGKPGILGVNKGPGVANIAAGAIYLAKENVPAIFIMGQRHRFYEQRVRRGKMQYMSHPRLFEATMKYVGIIEYPEQTDEIIHEAFRRALSGVPGPVYVELPQSVMLPRLAWPPAPAPSRYRLTSQQASADGVEAAAELLRTAKCPVLLVGQGAFVSRAHAELATLARLLACPILPSPSVEIVALEGLESHTFPYGSKAAASIVAEADVVLAIGTEIGESLHYGRGVHWSKGQTDRKWIYIEKDPTAIGVNRPIDVPLVGDLRDVIPQLLTAMASDQRDNPSGLAGWCETRTAQKQALLDTLPSGPGPIHPGRLAVEATKALPKDVVIVRDGGSSGMFFSAFTDFMVRDAMWNSNYGAVGPGLPYAVGAQLAVGPERRVVLLTGDSSILFHIAELETAVRENLPIVCIVAVDNAWGIEVAAYRANYGVETQTPGALWNRKVRLDLTAKSFGAHGEFVENIDDLGPAIERAFASGIASLIHVAVDPEVTGSFDQIPGRDEFRTWYGEEGDNLGFAGNPTPISQEPIGDRPISKGSGY